MTEDPPPALPAYYHDWKWAHVIFGKFFLAFCLIGTGLAGIILLRNAPVFAYSATCQKTACRTVAWRFMLLALVFESLC